MKTTLSVIFVAVLGLFLQAPAQAQFDLQITEVSPFGTDLNNPPDPDAVEFIEITNLGDTTFLPSDGDLFYDDEVPEAVNADQIFDIPSAGIAPNESIIFLNISFSPETGFTDDFTPETGAAFFRNQFPSYTGPIGFFDGSGLSSSNDDGANLFLTLPDELPILSDIVSSLVYPAGSQVAGQSFQVDLSGAAPAFAVPTPGFVNGATATVLLGDVNLDNVVDFFDIQPFIDLLAAQTFQIQADIDGSGDVNFFDIAPFIMILSGQ